MSRKRDKDRSKEEIAKQFLLPERQSKIATLLKQDGQAYCICRSSDSSRFMIGCDSCEEWYHGDCINITEKESKLIKQFFCVRCCDEDPTLQTKWKTRRREDSATRGHSEERKAKRRKERENSHQHQPKSGKSSKRCGQCMGCYRTDDCGRCDSCKDMKKHGGHSRLKLRCKHRQCANTQYTPQTQKKSRKRRDSSSDTGFGDTNAHLQTEYARQCYGPSCLNSSRFGSKYCSDVCGTKLATNRIYQVLPQRIQEWALSACLAEEKNKLSLDQIRRQQLEVRVILKELDRRHHELDLIVDRARHASIDVQQELQDEDENNEMSTYCITCGHEIHSRTAVRHMEKCFNKMEAQSSFGSIYKTKIEGSNMFCDYFNSSNATYCKRLRVLCPEHSKDAKVTDDEVCGCPLVTNVFNLTGEFCRIAKKSCVRHYVWEKLRRAEVDMERVRQWLKFDELLEQERQIRHNMASRAGVLSLMLHSTYNHEIMEQLTQASKDQGSQGSQGAPDEDGGKKSKKKKLR